jgi:uncharacterized oligopeptide transporter (OPT) family protein
MSESTTDHPPHVQPLHASTSQEEYDLHWLNHIYAADTQAQMTFRALFTGCFIGGIMSFSNLYVGLKTGWGLGASITAAILAFGLFSALKGVFGPIYDKASRRAFAAGGASSSDRVVMVLTQGFAAPFTVLENNTMQTAASSAAYMTSAGLVSAIPALYLTTGYSFTIWQLIPWLIGVSLVGTIAAIPVKKRLINQERLPFPSGIACAETLRTLHSAGVTGVAQAKAMGGAGVIGGIVALLRDGLSLLPSLIPFSSRMGGWTVGFEPSLVMIGAGALMGLRVTISMFIAAVITWAIIPELLFDRGYITCSSVPPQLRPVLDAFGMVNGGWLPDLRAWLLQVGQGNVDGAPAGALCTAANVGYRDINGWTLWPGVALMVAHSLVGLALQAPSMVRGMLATMRSAGTESSRAVAARLAEIEIPNSWFLIGMGIVGPVSVALQYTYFGIAPVYGALAVVLAVGLSFVAARSTGETDITPVGAMGKVTQLVFGGLIRGQIAPNLMTASVTGGAASQVGDLLTDLKTGHLLGAKPRYQFVAQVAGVFVGAVFAAFAYQMLVNPADLGSEKWPAPAAQTWAKVAELLSNGLESIEPHKLMAIQIAGAIGAAFAVLETLLPGKIRRLMPSIAGVGIAMMVPFFNTFSMLVGALIAEVIARRNATFAEKFVVVVASGFIAGETLMSVAIIVQSVLAG